MNPPPKLPTDDTLSSSTTLFLGHYVVLSGEFRVEIFPAPFLGESGQPDRMNTKPPGHEASGHEDEDTATTDNDKAPRDK